MTRLCFIRTELPNPATRRGEELGHEGLLALVRGLTISPSKGPVAFGQALVAGLKSFRGRAPQRDDETLVLIQRQAECRTICLKRDDGLKFI